MSAQGIFIVHGRDLLAREAVAHVLQNLDLDPVVLDERVPVGQTWIEGLEAVCNEVSFAIVILRPDDRGGYWNEPRRDNPRARQNVLFELGFMVGKLGRTRVCVLYEEGVEIPSDYNGVKFIKLGSEWDWKLHLVAALQEAGFQVDPNRVLKRSPGGVRDQQLIRDQDGRTLQIVADLHALARDKSDFRREVRFSGFLSAFAFGGEEMNKRPDGKLLSEEKDGLLGLARNGCEIYCIISMPTYTVNPHVVSLRLGTLLALLKSDDPALRHLHWCIAPRVESYVYIIGKISFLQGFKGDDSLRSFALTERRVSPEELHRQIVLFDERFHLHSTDMLRKHEIQRGKDLREDLLHATIREVEASLEDFSRLSVLP